MTQSTDTDEGTRPDTGGAPAASTPAMPPPEPSRLAEVQRLFKLELVSGQGIVQDRGAGFNPYDRGTCRDVWVGRRRA